MIRVRLRYVGCCTPLKQQIIFKNNFNWNRMNRNFKKIFCVRDGFCLGCGEDIEDSVGIGFVIQR